MPYEKFSLALKFSILTELTSKSVAVGIFMVLICRFLKTLLLVLSFSMQYGNCILAANKHKTF